MVYFILGVTASRPILITSWGEGGGGIHDFRGSGKVFLNILRKIILDYRIRSN